MFERKKGGVVAPSVFFCRCQIAAERITQNILQFVDKHKKSQIFMIKIFNYRKKFDSGVH